MSGRFELKQDDATGRRYWYGGEDGWKDNMEIGKDGELVIHPGAFAVGTVLMFTEPDNDHEQDPMSSLDGPDFFMAWIHKH